jgi:serine protease Do
MVLQFALIWTGHYDGMVDGDIGPRSIAAIASFQRENGWSPNGVLSEEQIRRLLQRSEQNQRSVGFRLLEDARSRILIGLPTSLMVRSNDTEFGTRWVLRDDAEVIVGRFGPAQRTLQQLRERIIQSGKIKNYSMDVRPTRSTFFLAGEDDTRVYYFTGRMEGVDTVAFSISYPHVARSIYDRITIAMSNIFHLRAVPALPLTTSSIDGGQADRAERWSSRGPGTPQPENAVPETRSQATQTGSILGSGFFVDDEGHVLTNAHVVMGCSQIVVKGHGLAKLDKVDPTNDLAILSTMTHKTTPFVRFRRDEVSLAENITVAGYPLQGMLGQSLNVTTGIVSSLLGPGNDSRFLQITAPLQSGNSGGPLIDAYGRLAGVITAKLNVGQTFAKAGVLPENIGFAIRANNVLSFLRAASIEPTVELEAHLKTPVDIAKEADRYTVQVACIRHN